MKVAVWLTTPLVLFGCKGEEEQEVVLPPSAPVVSVTPHMATSAQDISVVIDEHSIDPAGLSVSYRYEWATIGGETAEGDTLSASATARGEQWTVTVTPYNGEMDGSPGEATAVIVNAPPALDGVSLDPPNPDSTTDLTCVAGTTSDNDGDVVSLLYHWSVNGSGLSVPQSTLAATNYTRTDTVRCAVTPTDGFDSGASAFAEVTIANGLPSLDEVTLGPVGATVSDDLLCVPGTATDPDGDGVTLSFAWTVGGSAVAETSATLTSGNFEKAQEVVCIVTPNDGADSGFSVPSDGLTIANSPPVVHSAVITPDAPRTLDMLECQYSASDPDTDFLTPRFTWEVNEVVQSEASSTLFSTDFVRGQDVLCTVTVNDGTVDSNTATSEEVEVANTPPVVTAITFDPDPAYTNTHLHLRVDRRGRVRGWRCVKPEPHRVRQDRCRHLYRAAP
ncbi:MAG: hypothetical protein JRJ84_25780 [Deltaproteobacteria bacterium]|nr:hypothetical protein [Deltaproteobacteria bacterium]